MSDFLKNLVQGGRARRIETTPEYDGAPMMSRTPAQISRADTESIYSAEFADASRDNSEHLDPNLARLIGTLATLGAVGGTAFLFLMHRLTQEEQDTER